MKRVIALILVVLGFIGSVNAQGVADTSLLVNMFSFHMSGHVPGGDIANRYGSNMGVGGSYILKGASNWVLSADFTYFSGNDFKEDSIFDNLRDQYGEFINIYGEVGEAKFYERGFYAGLKGGRLFPVFGPNPNSGLLIMGSAGILQYKTLVHQDGEDIPYIINDYSKGYDRLTNGFGISEFIGYLHIDSREPINFYLGFEFHQAWTKNRREWDFYEMKKDDALRRDFLYGFRFGWIFPINKNTTSTYSYY